MEAAKIDTSLIWVYKLRGDYERAMSLADECLKVLKSSENSSVITSIHNTLGVIHYENDRLDEAEKYFRMVLDYRMKTNDYRGIARVKNNLGNVLTSKGDFEQAIAFYKEALILEEKVGERYITALLLENISMTCSDFGHFDDAVDYLARGLKIAKSIR